MRFYVTPRSEADNSIEKFIPHLRGLRDMAEADKYLADAGDNLTIESVVNAARMLAIQEKRPLLVYAYIRGLWEEALSVPMFPISGTNTSKLYQDSARRIQRYKELKPIVENIFKNNESEILDFSARIIYIFASREHPEYRAIAKRQKQGSTSVTLYTDNIDEILLPMIQRYERAGFFHPAILYIKVLMLRKSQLHEDAQAQMYVRIEHTEALSRLPLAFRWEVLIALYTYYSRIRRKEKAEQTLAKIKEILKKTRNHPITQYYRLNDLDSLARQDQRVREILQDSENT